jgi:hypothetical protein
MALDTKAARELLTTDDRQHAGVQWQPIDIDTLPKDIMEILKTVKNGNSEEQREALYEAVAKLVAKHVDVPVGKEISINFIPARLQYGFVNPKKKNGHKQGLRLTA